MASYYIFTPDLSGSLCIVLGVASSAILCNSIFREEGSTPAITVIENPLGLETPTPKRLDSLLVIEREVFLLTLLLDSGSFFGLLELVIPYAPYYSVFYKSTLSWVLDI